MQRSKQLALALVFAVLACVVPTFAQNHIQPSQIVAPAFAPNQNAVYLSQLCGQQANCFQVHADVQVAQTATYSPAGTGGVAATKLTTNNNDSFAEFLGLSGTPTFFGGYMTVSASVVNGTVLSLFKTSGAATVGTCWGSNNQSGTSTTVTVSVSPTGGAGHALLVGARAQGTATINFSDSNSQTYANSVASPILASTLEFQQGYTLAPVGGTYTLTATFGATETFRSVFACEATGVTAFDAAVGNPSPASTTAAAGPVSATAASDLAFLSGSVGSTTATFTAGNIGTVAEVTTQTSDPPFVSTDVNKRFLATTNCDTGNGYQNCTQSFPAGRIASVIDAHHATTTTIPTLASASTGTNFTGWFEWGHDDANQIVAAYAASQLAPGGTLYLPCGMMFTSKSPFIAGPAQFYAPNIIGCGGSGGSVILATADFAYTSSTNAHFYYNPNTNWSGWANFYQTPFLWTVLRDFTIWGGGIDGAGMTTALPFVKGTGLQMTNVWVVGLDWNAGATINTTPVYSVTAVDMYSSGAWASGNQGLIYNGDTGAPSGTQFSGQCHWCFIGVQSTSGTGGIGLNILGGNFATYHSKFPPGSDGANNGVVMSAGWWRSFGDDFGRLQISGGRADLDESRDSVLTSTGIVISGTGYVAASHSQIDTLILSAGTFQDLGGNYKCSGTLPCSTPGVGPSWTQGTLTITGGTVIPFPQTSSCTMATGTTCTATLTSANRTPTCSATDETLGTPAVSCTYSAGTITVTAAVANSHVWYITLL